MWDPVVRTAKRNKPLAPAWILVLGLTSIGWMVSFFRIFLSRSKQEPEHSRFSNRTATTAGRTADTDSQCAHRALHGYGGMDDAKEQIRSVVKAHLNSSKYEALWGAAKWNLVVWTTWNREDLLG